MVDAKSLTQTITVRVKIKRWKELVWRTKIMMALIRLAAWISWFNIEIELGEIEDEKV